VVVDWKQNGPWTPDLYLTQLEDMLTRAHATLKDRICNLVGHAHTHHEPISLLCMVRLDSVGHQYITSRACPISDQITFARSVV
jgi:hypothetical protein